MERDLILLKAISFNVIIAVLALFFGFIFGGPRISIEFKTALIISSFFFILFLSIIFWTAIFRQKAGESKIIFHGPYEHVRYPAYFSIVFLLNPGLAFLFRSWLYLLSLVLVYFVWKQAIGEEDTDLAKETGDVYRKYRFETPAIFPRIYEQKYLFYPLTGLMVFSLVLISLNFPAFYIRYAEWNSGPIKKLSENTNTGSPVRSDSDIVEKIISVNSEQNKQNTEAAKNESAKEISQPVVKYNLSNSVVIGKIGVNAPLIKTQTVPTDLKKIHEDLNRGIVIYPGSVQPGEIGNFFITGHSSVYLWNKTPYGQVFSRLEKLEVGDIVTIYYDQQKYQYRITEKSIKSANDVWLEHPKNKSIISIMTCWPVGTNLKRLVVTGELIR